MWACPANLSYALVPIVAAIVFFINRLQLISMLLMMETFVIISFSILCLVSGKGLLSPSFLLLYMCVMVAEAMVGISILISATRNKGTSFLA